MGRERILPESTYEEGDTSIISDHVASQLKHHISDMYDDKDEAELATHFNDKDHVFGGLKTQHQLTSHFAEQFHFTDNQLKMLE